MRVWLTLVLVAALAGCAGIAGERRLTVLAAASLTETFTELGRRFEADHPGVRVVLSFGGSATLAQQINNGAPADVFAAASSATMRQVTEAGNAHPPAVFARNTLVIAVAQGNPEGIAGLSDLAKPGVKVALCAPQVPCGAAAESALTAAGVALRPVTQEQDVKAALAKLRLGEVDAALVYRTDVRAVSDVDGVELPGSPPNDYLIAMCRDGEPARDFVSFVLSEPARKILAEAGFS